MQKIRLVFEKQLLHLALLSLLLAGVGATSRLGGFFAGSLYGIEARTWFYVAVAIPIAHQTFIWFCWRTELYQGLLTRWFGDRAFAVYAWGFAILIFLKPVSVTLLAVANRDTLPLGWGLRCALASTMALPAAYLFYSVARYFGFRRAIGVDHFDPDTYRHIPYVRDGIYRFTQHGMYVFGHLFVWIPAVLGASLAATAVALFSHVYIWVHYHCLERPDVRRIYASSNA